MVCAIDHQEGLIVSGWGIVQYRLRVCVWAVMKAFWKWGRIGTGQKGTEAAGLRKDVFKRQQRQEWAGLWASLLYKEKLSVVMAVNAAVFSEAEEVKTLERV